MDIVDCCYLSKRGDLLLCCGAAGDSQTGRDRVYYPALPTYGTDLLFDDLSQVCGVTESVPGVVCVPGVVPVIRILTAAAKDKPWLQRQYYSTFVALGRSSSSGLAELIREFMALSPSVEILPGRWYFPETLHGIARLPSCCSYL